MKLDEMHKKMSELGWSARSARAFGAIWLKPAGNNEVYEVTLSLAPGREPLLLPLLMMAEVQIEFYRDQLERMKKV